MKLDLHTHCGEALYMQAPSRDLVAKIVAAAQARGLDGIAVTDHCNREYGFKVREIVEKHFAGQLLVIPGQEIDNGLFHVVELYLPGNVTFRFVAHPGHPRVTDLSAGIDRSFHGIERHNHTYDADIDGPAVARAAKEHGLLILQNSDAHFLSDIGKYYNDITIEELCARASRTAPSRP